MNGMRTLFFIFATLALALLAPARSAGDTIVLKNGRRITATGVVDEGDKVRYQTAAGELSLPRSIIDHIERGGSGPDSSTESAAKLSITPPAMDLSTLSRNAKSSAVHDGAVDRDFLAQVGNESRSGTPEAAERAAMAYYAAAEFEWSHGDFNRAVADERMALTYAPENVVLLLNIAYAHLRDSQYKEALEYLERARRVAPENADEAKLEGWAYYGLNKMDRAVAEWNRAFGLRPDPEVKAALDKAQRDKDAEENYKENESTHFNLRYNGGAEPALAREILKTLESHFSSIESTLDYQPPEPIGVILYTREAFADITRAPSWVGALNDGRIRVPVQGLAELTPDLSRILKHELTHSFVQQKTRGRAPTWLQEGLAQWMEGARSNAAAASLMGTYTANRAIPLGLLERPWLQLSSAQAAYAYAWSLANMECIIQAYGMGDIERILDHLAAGSSTEEALREVVHSDYSDLMRETVQYLRKTYGN
jgi:tetratricopeptide (TPR) repeat protein